MPVSRIDGEIRPHRGADFSKDAAAQVKRAERWQERADKQRDKAREDRRKHPGGIPGMEADAIGRDRDGQEHGGRGGAGGKQKQSGAPKEQGGGERSVDIRI